jgi:hypothetical protein
MSKRKAQSVWCGVRGIVIVLAWAAASASFCCAEPLSSTEIISQAARYDNATVTYTGEVIGEIMRRGAYCWMNTSDGKNALGIWVPVDMAKDITYTGSFKSMGDMIEVTGVVHRSCPQHGGDLDIHAEKIRKVQEGRLRQEKLNTEKLKYVFIAMGILGAIWILRRLLHR